MCRVSCQAQTHFDHQWALFPFLIGHCDTSGLWPHTVLVLGCLRFQFQNLTFPFFKHNIMLRNTSVLSMSQSSCFSP